ncbi:MAG: TM2 domain-containing protein [bacterium]
MNQGQENVTVNQTNTPAQKSKVCAGILGILLGSLGIHNFYLGYTGKGVAQLLITVLSCGFLAVISSVWGLVEGIMILTGSIDKDASGQLLKD